MEINLFLNLMSIIILVLLFFVLSLPIGGIKILISKGFNLDSPPFLWLQYSLFYTIAFSIYVFVSFKFPYDNSSKIITMLVILLIEIAYFYFRYYILESKLQYALYLFFQRLLTE